MRSVLLSFFLHLAMVLSNTTGVIAQKNSIDVQIGLGYLEHISVGLAATRNNRTSLTLSYGSNFMISARKFSSLHLSYDHLLGYQYAGLRAGLGAKAGFTDFEDENYRWKVITIAPYIIVEKKLRQSTSIGVKSGVGISKIQSVTRLSYGDIGMYKRYLPELQIYLRHKLIRSRDK
jgi:hypothetical protein